MAAIKIAYIGGGSTRAPGAMHSFVQQGQDLNGSEICLVDLDEDRLRLVRTIAQKMAAARGLDLTITATTDRHQGLVDADAILTSFRPGGFEARVCDEGIPLAHGVIGQETQGPGGMFMSLRSVHVLRGILEDVDAVCPNVRIFDSQTRSTSSRKRSQGGRAPRWFRCARVPIYFPAQLTEAVGLDPSLLDVVCVGINHASWSVQHLSDGRDAIAEVRHAWHAMESDAHIDLETRRLLKIMDLNDSFPSGYFQYYLFERELARELSEKPTTRAQDILAMVPTYWEHYESQAATDDPRLDPARSRGGINELELAVDAINYVFNDRHLTLPVNVANNGALPGFPDDLIVEVLGDCSAEGIVALPVPAPLPHHLAGLVENLAEYQMAAAEAAWSGTRVDGLRALAMHPFVRSLALAERIYDELADAHRDYLPERLLASTCTTPSSARGRRRQHQDGRGGCRLCRQDQRRRAPCCADIYGAPTPDDAIAEIVGVASAAMAVAGTGPDAIAIASFSLAGADWPEDVRLLESALRAALRIAGPYLVVNDAVGALWVGTVDGIGAAAACGTYAAVAASGEAGTWRSSFWSEPAGAVHLAEAALRAVCRAQLGTGPATGLRERMLESGGFGRVEDLLHHYTFGEDHRGPRSARWHPRFSARLMTATRWLSR